MRSKSLIALLLVSIALIAGCKGEQKAPEAADPWSFVIYPGSRYLGQLTDVHKAAYKAIDPNAEVRPTAVYDTDASVEDVARFYASEYGYQLAAEAPADATKKPDAYFRSGDLATDHKAIEGLLPKLNLHPDAAKAIGAYRAAEIAPKVNRPRVTIQRPYFDVTKSEVVDRTFILMTKDPTK